MPLLLDVVAARLPEKGYRERQAFARYLFGELGDEPRHKGDENCQYPKLSKSLTGTFHPGNPPNLKSSGYIMINKLLNFPRVYVLLGPMLFLLISGNSTTLQPHKQNIGYKSPTDFCRKTFGSLPSIASDSNNTMQESSETDSDSVDVNITVNLFRGNDSQMVWVVNKTPSRCWNRILLNREKDGLYYKLLDINVDEVKPTQLDASGFPIKFQAKVYPGQMSDGWQSDYSYDAKFDSFLQTKCHSINLRTGKTDKQPFPCINLYGK